jgi:hypothetical protein
MNMADSWYSGSGDAADLAGRDDVSGPKGPYAQEADAEECHVPL